MDDRRIGFEPDLDIVEMAYFKQLIKNNAHLIIEFSQEGGILNAATS